EEARGDAPGALALALLEQLAEHGHERGGDRRVGKQRSDEVRDLERDRERVDPPTGAEVVGGDDLPDEAKDSREPGCEREDRRRPGQPAARVSPVHVASIGTGSAVPEGGRGAHRRLPRRRPGRNPRPGWGSFPPPSALQRTGEACAGPSRASDESVEILAARESIAPVPAVLARDRSARRR